MSGPWAFFALVRDAWALEPAAFEAAARTASGRAWALAIVFVAGASELGGQGLVLLLNRVPPWRFALSLALAGLVYLAGAMATALSLWLVANLVLGPLTGAPLPEPVTVRAVTGVVALAYAPRLLGFFVLTPYLGEPFGRVLDAWVLAGVVLGFRAAFGVPLWAAVLCGALGFAATASLRALLGRPLAALARSLRAAAAGRPLALGPPAMLRLLVERARREGSGGAGPRAEPAAPPRRGGEG